MDWLLGKGTIANAFAVAKPLSLIKGDLFEITMGCNKDGKSSPF